MLILLTNIITGIFIYMGLGVLVLVMLMVSEMLSGKQSADQSEPSPINAKTVLMNILVWPALLYIVLVAIWNKRGYGEQIAVYAKKFETEKINHEKIKEGRLPYARRWTAFSVGYMDSLSYYAYFIDPKKNTITHTILRMRLGKLDIYLCHRCDVDEDFCMAFDSARSKKKAMKICEQDTEWLGLCLPDKTEERVEKIKDYTDKAIKAYSDLIAS